MRHVMRSVIANSRVLFCCQCPWRVATGLSTPFIPCWPAVCRTAVETCSSASSVSAHLAAVRPLSFALLLGEEGVRLCVVVLGEGVAHPQHFWLRVCHLFVELHVAEPYAFLPQELNSSETEGELQACCLPNCCGNMQQCLKRTSLPGWLRRIPAPG